MTQLTRVRLVDVGGRGVCVFERWQSRADSFWMLAPRPDSRRSIRRAQEAAELNFGSAEFADLEVMAEVNRLNAGDGIAEYADDQLVRINLPRGPSLRWDKVTAVLDNLAAAFPDQEYLEMTVAAFRRCFG